MSNVARSTTHRVAVSCLAAATAMLTLVACGPVGSESELVVPQSQPVYPELATYPDVPVITDVPYSTVDGTTLHLDTCLPPTDGLGDEPSAPRASIVSIHGGSWAQGD